MIYNAKSQNISNEGTDFWAVFPSHDPSPSRDGPQLANITIYVTSKSESYVTVTCNGRPPQSRPIPPNTPVPFNVPRADAYIDYNEQNTNLVNRGIHIQVREGAPKVAVYAHIYAGARSAASLILPLESLGQKYYSMNYDQTLDASRMNRNFLIVVATEPNTDVIIHPRSRPAVKVTLANPGDLYQYMPEGAQDISGTLVEIDPSSPDNCTKRFAVFSGSTSVTIGSSDCSTSRDPLYQQLYPTSSWGKTYCIVPFKDRFYHYRILAEEDNTKVNIGGQVITLNRGFPYVSPIYVREPVLVSADKKISVAEYSLTQDCSGTSGARIGDPEMVMLNPTEFNIKTVTLFSSELQDIAEKYINVSIKTSAAHTFKINGIALPEGSWNEMPANPELSYAQVRVFDESSTLTANEGFNAIAYGFGDHESYAYSAGTNLAANNYLLVSNSVTGYDSPNACIDQESDFKIVFPFQVQNNKITWQLDNEPAVEITAPPRIFNAPNGDLLYEYIYDLNKIFPDVSSHTMAVTATMPNANNCIGSVIEYAFDFNSYPIPTAAISVPAEACFEEEVMFIDNSLSNVADKPVNKWLWDFDDGTTSTEQNPKHIYKTAGPFRVKFSAGLEDGCLSDVIEKTITVKPKILPDFKVNPVECITSEVVVEDRSTVENNGAVINSWSWDFGDGSPPVLTKIASHTYALPGEYDISLIAGAANGCISKPKTYRVTIKGLPIAGFTVPEVCINDTEVRFINTSTDADGSSTSNLTYLWDFGDGIRSSRDRNPPPLRFSAAGKYTIKLRVVTGDGCITNVSKDLVVNGAVITPVFTVVNQDNLCSQNKVTVINKSSVDQGKPVRVVWFKDYDGNPQDFITDEDPEEGKSYEFEYPPASSPAPRPFTILIRVYSGITCFEEFRQEIMIYPSPELIFGTIQPICLNSGLFTVNHAKEVLGLPGKGKYNGPGISTDGTFDPKAAGIGSHTISYTFEADNRCSEMKTQTITVYPIPLANYTRDVFIYAGEKKQLDLSATGADLTYKWEPAINLDKDNVQNPVVTADRERTYTVTIRSSQGCVIIEKIYVHVIPEVDTHNAFSPNGDGINDTWVLKNIEIYLNSTVEIFNRYGHRVYYSKGFYKPFDGNYKDQALSVGTYYYIINPNNGRKILTGSLTLIR
ncbi:MAG TPA: PKD domain-containing protein [Pedobacter sp.]|uniref:PKD domain-containing protein n=1 Tax=Pedobacter sp. TaxID=1411316 RepID=UPI002BB670F3|nr:PKD domain-containing protein [Pedobacter sp.]HMI05611.1 PKD domain-containing protein [Pedobacter sp.]